MLEDNVPMLGGQSKLSGREPELQLWEAWALLDFPDYLPSPRFIKIGVFIREKLESELLGYANTHHTDKAPFIWNGSQLITDNSGWAYGFIHRYNTPKR